MNTKLNYIRNWLELAYQANWSVSRLAMLTKVNRRTLHRHFRRHMKKTPQEWLAEHRQQRAVELLSCGLSVKETATRLGYEHAGTFSREFKKRCGYCPTNSISVSKGHNLSHLAKDVSLGKPKGFDLMPGMYLGPDKINAKNVGKNLSVS